MVGLGFTAPLALAMLVAASPPVGGDGLGGAAEAPTAPGPDEAPAPVEARAEPPVQAPSSAPEAKSSPPPATPVPRGSLLDPFAAKPPPRAETTPSQPMDEPTQGSPPTGAGGPAELTDAAPPTAPAQPMEPPAQARSERALDPRDAPRHLRRKGIGLFVGAGVSALLGGVMTASRVGVLRGGGCREADTRTDYAETTRDCVREPLTYIAASWVQLVSNGVAFGLTAGGGAVAGRHHAYWDYRRGEERKSVGFIAGGATLMSLSMLVGTVVQLRMWGTAYGFTDCGGEFGGAEGTFEAIPLEGCWERRWTGYIVGTELTQLGGVAGVGLLAYGASYRKNGRMLRAIGGVDRGVELRWSPVTTPRLTGIMLRGRF